MHVPCLDTASELLSSSERAHRRVGDRARTARDARLVDPEWAHEAREGEPLKPFDQDHLHQLY